MVWEPTASAAVVNVALPLVTEPLPSNVVPSMKFTFPVAAAAVDPPAETVAVNVIDCPNAEGATEELTVVVVATLLTTWVTAWLEVLVVKLASPL